MENQPHRHIDHIEQPYVPYVAMWLKNLTLQPFRKFNRNISPTPDKLESYQQFDYSSSKYIR